MRAPDLDRAGASPTMKMAMATKMFKNTVRESK